MAFRADPGVWEELRELAALERECCAFADWTLRASRERFVLDVSAASERAVAAAQAMFTGLERPGGRC
jgi:hypothetical protein